VHNDLRLNDAPERASLPLSLGRLAKSNARSGLPTVHHDLNGSAGKSRRHLLVRISKEPMTRRRSCRVSPSAQDTSLPGHHRVAKVAVAGADDRWNAQLSRMNRRVTSAAAAVVDNVALARFITGSPSGSSCRRPVHRQVERLSISLTFVNDAVPALPRYAGQWHGPLQKSRLSLSR